MMPDSVERRYDRLRERVEELLRSESLRMSTPGDTADAVFAVVATEIEKLPTYELGQSVSRQAVLDLLRGRDPVEHLFDRLADD